MRLIAALLVAAGAISDERWFTDEDLAVEHAVPYEEFEKTFYSRARSTGFSRSMEEYYRIYARECHNFGGCKKWKKAERTIYPDNSQVGCPEDEFAPHEPWPANWATGEDESKTINDRTILLDHDITLHKLRIAGTGKLIVKGRFSLKAFHSTFREFLCRLFTIF